jgi:hypothetical protein
MEVYIEGTLGDAYMANCILYEHRDKPITVYHYTECTYWLEEIKDIYSLSPNIEVSFVDEPFSDKDKRKIVPLPKINSGMTYFPEWREIDNNIEINEDYTVVLSHSGKPIKIGRNAKYFDETAILHFIKQKPEKIVLLGSEERYSEIGSCINLVNKTNILQAIDIVRKAKKFVGPEGLLSFVALSHNVHSDIFFSSYQAVYHRIVETPWYDNCNLIDMTK